MPQFLIKTTVWLGIFSLAFNGECAFARDRTAEADSQSASPATLAPSGNTAPQEKSAEPAENSRAGTPATVLGLQEVDGVMGKNVRSAKGEDMGHIVDVIVSGNGKVHAAIIDFGGFLGVGSRKIAVDWRVLQFGKDGKIGVVTSALTRDQVRITPEYKPGEPIVILGPEPIATPSAQAPEAVQNIDPVDHPSATPKPNDTTVPAPK